MLVLEHVDGETLSEHMKRGALPEEEVRAIARQILLALEVAHGAGIVHRDIKPGNVMITGEGVVKVLDFGIAKQHGLDVANGDQGESLALTLPRSFIGTAAYMSPEQARGRSTDRRTDIWAFGCILYEMLGGRRAFEGETISDTIAGVLRAEPDWALLESAPRGVLAVLRRCLEKDADRRWRDAADVRLELEEAWTAPDLRGQVVPRGRRSVAVAAGCAIVGAVVAVGGVAAFHRLAPARGGQGQLARNPAGHRHAAGCGRLGRCGGGVCRGFAGRADDRVLGGPDAG